MIDKEKFCELIKTHEKSIYYMAYSVVKNNADAEEIISESIYRAFLSIDSLNSEKAFKAWMLRIVHNIAIDYIRKNTKYIPTDEFGEQGINSKENEIIDKVVVREAVESLKQPYRTVVVLFYFEEMSVFEIANVTESSSTAVRKQLSRARIMLKKILKGDALNE